MHVSPLLERLGDLERIASPLEPGADERAELHRSVFLHAERSLASLESAPAFHPGTGSGTELEGMEIGREPAGLRRALLWLAKNVDGVGAQTAGAGFFSYIPGGNLYHAALADFLSSNSNPYSGRFAAAPGAVRVENQILAWLGSVVGYPATAEGNLASGGSLANLIAIVTAREASGRSPREAERSVVYLTEHVHHCVPKGLKIAGMGECTLRRIPLDACYRMRPDALERAVREDLAAGRKPWLVVASAGTVDTGAIDPLEAIAEIAERHRLWFHVDGAYGALFALCREGRSVLAGIERSDSVVLDPHKALFIPYGTGAVLVKDGHAMRAAHSFEASYIPDDFSHSEPSPADHSPELSRPFRALRLWLPLQVLGTRPFEAALAEKMLLARYAYERLQALGVELGPEPDLSLFVFRVVPDRGDPDGFNERLERWIAEDGRVSISSTLLNGVRWLRFAVLAQRTHLESVDRAIDVIREGIARLSRD